MSNLSPTSGPRSPTGASRCREGATIADLIAGRDWLFADDAYHLDVSHLAATVRISPLADRPRDDRAGGRPDRLRPQPLRAARYEGDPPFERHLRRPRRLPPGPARPATSTRPSRHFRAKLESRDPDGRDARSRRRCWSACCPARTGSKRLDVAAEHLARLPESVLACPGVPQLCQRLGRLARLAEIARKHGDLVLDSRRPSLM